MPEKRRRSKGPAPPAGQYAAEIDGRVILSRALSAEAVRAYGVAAGFHAQRDGRSSRPLIEGSLAEVLAWCTEDARSAIEELADVLVFPPETVQLVDRDWMIDLQSVRGDATRRLDPSSSTVRRVTIDLRPFHPRRLSAEVAWAYGAVAVGTSTLVKGELLFLTDAMQLLGEDNDDAAREWLGSLASLGLIEMDQDADDPPIRLAELTDDIVANLRLVEFTCEELGRAPKSIRLDSPKQGAPSVAAG